MKRYSSMYENAQTDDDKEAKKPKKNDEVIVPFVHPVQALTSELAMRLRRLERMSGGQTN